MKHCKTPHRAITFALAVSCTLLLSGCVTHAGVPHIQITYPSGTEITPYTYPESPMEIEGSALVLAFETYRTDKGNVSDFSVLNAGGEVLFEQEGANRVLRGIEEAGCIWVAAESWATSQTWGFIDGQLTESSLYCIDKENGDLLLEYDSNNEMFLTAKGDRAYFYDRGNDPESKYFGMISTPAKCATVYYRSLSDWETPVVVSTLAYGGNPDEYDKTTWVHEDENTENPVKAMEVAFDKLIRKDVEISYQAKVESFHFTVMKDKITLEVVGSEYIKADPPIVDEEKVFYGAEIALED